MEFLGPRREHLGLLRSILLLKPVSDFANSIAYYSNPEQW